MKRITIGIIWPVILGILMVGMIIYTAFEGYTRITTASGITYEGTLTKTESFMIIQDPDLKSEMEWMWEEYVHTSDTDVKMKYEDIASKVFSEIQDKLGDKYRVVDTGSHYLVIVKVVNVKKQMKRSKKVQKVMDNLTTTNCD